MNSLRYFLSGIIVPYELRVLLCVCENVCECECVSVSVYECVYMSVCVYECEYVCTCNNGE